MVLWVVSRVFLGGYIVCFRSLLKTLMATSSTIMHHVTKLKSHVTKLEHDNEFTVLK